MLKIISDAEKRKERVNTRSSAFLPPRASPASSLVNTLWYFCVALACNSGEDRKGRGEGCNSKGLFENIEVVGFVLFPGAFRPAGKGSFFFQHFSPAVPARIAAQTRAEHPLLPLRTPAPPRLPGLFLKMLSTV